MPVRRSVLTLVHVLLSGLCASVSCAQEVTPPPGYPVMIINGREVRDARELAVTPAAREALRNRTRAIMPMRYPDVARVVGMTPDEVSRLFDLLADQQVAAPDFALGPTQELARMSDAARVAFERQSARDAEVARLLGSRYEAWLRYSQSLRTRMQVEQLRRALTTTGQPIDDATADSLVEALDVEVRFDRLKGAVAMTTLSPDQQTPEQLASRLASRNSLLLEVAARWLTPGQLAEYSRQLQSSGPITDLNTLRSPPEAPRMMLP